MRHLKIFLLDSRQICERFHTQDFWVRFVFEWAKGLDFTGNVEMDAKIIYLQYLAEDQRLSELYSMILDLQKVLFSSGVRL